MGRSKPKRRKLRGNKVKVADMFLVTDAAPDLSVLGRRYRAELEATGRCPCGAVVQVPRGMKRGTQVTIEVIHVRGCPAVSAPQAGQSPEFVEWLIENTKRKAADNG
jgi:hypothetical protein